MTVDLPPEEAADLNVELKQNGIHNIFLLAPTTKLERAKSVVSLASGFVYYVSLKGVTGAGHLDTASVADNVSQIRALTDLPICVGFGIKDGASAKAIAETADGAVVGSVLVAKMAELAQSNPEQIAQGIAELVVPIRHALDEPQ